MMVLSPPCPPMPPPTPPDFSICLRRPAMLWGWYEQSSVGCALRRLAVCALAPILEASVLKRRAMRRTGFGTNRSFRVPRWLDYRLPAPDQPSFVRWTREVRRLGLGWPRIGPILWVTRAYGSRARRISLTLPADLSNSSGLRNDIASGWICGQERCEFASFLLCPICRPKLLKEFSFDDGQHRSNYTPWAYRRRGQLFAFTRETHPTVSEQLSVEKPILLGWSGCRF